MQQKSTYRIEFNDLINFPPHFLPTMTRLSCFYKHCIAILLFILTIPCFGQINDEMFRCSAKDKSGDLWFGTMGAGVYRYDHLTDRFTNFTKHDGLNDNNVDCVFEDRSGKIWFGTDYGVSCYDGKSFSDMTSKKGLCKFNINCIMEDRAGNIWIGSNGWGVCKYNPVSGEITNYTKEQGLGSNAVQCMLEDKSGIMWLGERDGGVCCYDSASNRFTKINGCFSTQLMGITEDKSGNLWFLNLYNGLCKYDPQWRNGNSSGVEQSGFTHITREDGLCSDSACCMYLDQKGNLWLGSDSKWNTGAGGLCRFDGKSFHQFTSKDGLENSDVWSVVEDNDGNLWVGTRGGLYRYHFASGKFISYMQKVNSSN